MALERLALQLGACALLVLGAWLWHADQVHDAREAGRAEVIEAGRKQHALDAAAALATEREQREQNRLKDEAAKRKEQEYAENLADAQRRVRAGDDSLRIAINAIRATSAPADRPAAGGPAPDEFRAELVPEVAADALGNAAAVAGIVRKFDRLEQRFEACRAMNNGPVLTEKRGE